MIQFIANIDHYKVVLEKVKTSKSLLWVGTADIKDLYVKSGLHSEPFLSVIANLIKQSVDVRLIHAKEPGQAFREDFDKYPVLKTMLERVLCPRVHFKIIIIDGKYAYIGSANLTGAGMGMKSSNRRNFEAGIFTDEPSLVESAMEQFDSVWRGDHCKKCGRRDFCGDPIN
ncbi:MAG: phospholipase [Muribaculaceae bacterium]|nr:phospholipase [Muribaculaceae bacterium]